MSQVMPGGGIRLLLKVAAHSSRLHLQSKALACSKHSQVFASSSYHSTENTHPLPWMVTNEKSATLLCRELVNSSLLKGSSFHTASLNSIQKQERAEKGAASTDGKNKEESGSDEATDTLGRVVPHQVLELFGENNEPLGSVPRSDAVKMSEEQNLKLVLVNPQTRPYPSYRLMSQEKFKNEQVRIKDSLKKSTKPQVKEVRLACGIGEHDLAVKRRHMNDWFEDPKHDIQVKVVVKGGKSWKPVTEEEQVALIHRLMVGMEDRITFGNKPKQVGKNNPSLTVLLRKMSVKEKAAYNKQKNMEQSVNSTNDDA